MNTATNQVDLTEDIELLLSGQIADSSKKRYLDGFRKYQEYAFWNKLSYLNSTTLVSYRQHMVNEEQLAASTINNRLSIIISVIKIASETGLIGRVTAESFEHVKRVKEDTLRDRKKTHREILPEEMREIVAKPGCEALKGLRDTALLHVMASTGGRVSEIANAKTTDLEGKPGAYFLIIQASKNQPEAIGVPLSDEAFNAVEDWLDARSSSIASEFLFVSTAGRGDRWTDKAMSSEAIWQLVKKYAGEDVSPHSFRRFVGTQLAQRDILIAQEVLRHKDIKTTVNHYVFKKSRPGVTNNLF